MNSVKLTNVLLGALLLTNGLILCGWVCSSMHHRNHDRFAMHKEFTRRFDRGWGFHHHHGGWRGNDGGFRHGNGNHHHAMQEESGQNHG